MNAYFDAMRRYATFSGRSTRSQFWFYTLIFSILMIVCFAIDVAMDIGSAGEPILLLTGLCNLIHFIPSLAVMVRRLHDAGQSGWLVLIGIVPLLGQVVLVVFAVMPSSREAKATDYPNPAHPLEPAQRAAVGDLGPITGAVGRSTADRLEQLAGLRAAGTIDEPEFQRMKAEVLRSRLQPDKN